MQEYAWEGNYVRKTNVHYHRPWVRFGMCGDVCGCCAVDLFTLDAFGITQTPSTLHRSVGCFLTKANLAPPGRFLASVGPLSFACSILGCASRVCAGVMRGGTVCAGMFAGVCAEGMCPPTTNPVGNEPK